MRGGTGKQEWVERLREAAASGALVDLAPGLDDDELVPPNSGDGVPARRIPAGEIRKLLLEPGLITDPQGLKIRGALITGALNFDHAKLPCRLVFDHCRFEQKPSFQMATLPGLVLRGVTLPGLSLFSTRLSGSASLYGLRSTGSVSAQMVRIGGLLRLTEARLSNPGGNALNLDGAEIAGGAFLEGLDAVGEVRAFGAHLHGGIDLTKANLKNPDGVALNLGGAEIAGGVMLAELETAGEVDATSASLGSIDLPKAKLNNPDGIALNLERAEITGDAILTKLETTGAVRAKGAHFAGPLVLVEAKLRNPNGEALNLDRTEIAGGAFLTKLETAGVVRAHSAHIGGLLNLTEAKLHNPNGRALHLDGIEITGGAALTKLETTGEFLAQGTHFRRWLDLTEAKLHNPNGRALHLGGAQVTGPAFLMKLETVGELIARGSHFGDQLNLTGAKLSNPPGNALDLSAASLNILTLNETFTVEGRTDLSFTTIRILSVGMKRPDNGMPTLSGAQGWTLGAVYGYLGTDRESAREWLDTIDTQPPVGPRREFASQPWKEMAKIYDQIGQPEDARRLRFWAAQRATRVAPWTSKLVRWPYGWLVGYGYYPLIVVGWLAVLWVTVFVLAFLHASAFTPTLPGASTVTVITGENRSEEVRATGATAAPPGYPPFEAGLFAVDTAIPAAATGQTDAWRITGNTWLQGVFTAIKAFAWILTALLLAGITGILRKD